MKATIRDVRDEEVKVVENAHVNMSSVFVRGGSHYDRLYWELVGVEYNERDIPEQDKRERANEEQAEAIAFKLRHYSCPNCTDHELCENCATQLERLRAKWPKQEDEDE
jgi:hypothetical protein